MKLGLDRVDIHPIDLSYRNKPTGEGKKMKTIEIAGQTLTVKGELKNGAFYLEGPRGGNVVFAKPIAENLYSFYKATGGTALNEKSGLIKTATREELAA